MASDPAANGGSEASFDDLSPAQRLKEKHNNGIPHRSTVEDAVDEEISQSLKAGPEATSDASFVPAEVPPSEKALGKQKEREDVNGIHPDPKAKIKAALDPLSEESFPALGGGPKSQTPAAAKTWGMKKSTPLAQPHSNGLNGSTRNGQASPSASSRASTPPVGTWNAPPSKSRGTIDHRLPIPGKCTERIRFAPVQLKPRGQLRKPIPEILRAINKKSKANVEMKPGPNGYLYFEATGPVDAVRQALLETAKEIGSQQSAKVPIPISVRPHIIGLRGAIVQGIEHRTGARIQVPKNEDLPPNVDDDDSMTIDVFIEGDAVAAEWARREIEEIVNERTSTVNMLLRNVPAEFFPYIAGPHNSGINELERIGEVKVEIPHYHTWSRQPPSTPSRGELAQFVPDPKHHIRVSGDRLAAQKVRAEIERQAEHLSQQITLAQLALNRGQHQFILGEHGITLHEFLAETGCTVLMPPLLDESELIYITGPLDKIDAGVEKVIFLASLMQMSSIDIARLHPNAPTGPQAHARVLTFYLQQRRAIERLEEQYDLRIVLPTTQAGPSLWEVYSKDAKNTIRARSEILNTINAYPPARVRHLEVDSFYHQHLQQRGAEALRDEYGVYLLLLNKVDSKSDIALIYEGIGLLQTEYQFPKQRPSASELAESQQALDNAQEHILGLIQGQEELSTARVEVPSKFHEKARKFVSSEQKATSGIPVQIIFGKASPITGPLENSKTAVGSDGLENEINLRGPISAVRELKEKIEIFAEEERQNDLERGHVTIFEFPQKYANILIGKKGENIKKYREDFDLDIQVNDGKVEIKGPKAKADLARTRILSLCKKLDDEATHVLRIKPQYHRDLIGAKGSQVNRLQLRYNVRIQFPRSAHGAGDDRSVADGASDVGGSRNSRPNQAPDEVIIRGPKKGADEARDELQNLLQWTIDNSHGSTVSVAQSQIPSLIGQGGREMESIRLSSGAQIDVPNRDAAESSGRVQIQIKGTKKQVEEAKKLLEQKAKLFDESIIKSIEVDKKYHKALKGPGGSHIRRIINESGGTDDHRESARLIRYRFPSQDSPDKLIRFEGNRAAVEKIIGAIKSFVNQRDSQTSAIIEVVPEKHRLLIGHGGETRRNLESQFKVSIDIPKISQQGPARSQIKIEGQPKDVEQAKAHILTLTKDEDGEIVQVPRRLHHSIFAEVFHRLRRDFKVTIDHAGQQPPSKPKNSPRSSGQGAGALPLITDDQESLDKYSWEIVDVNVESTEPGDIPWVLRGSPENVSKARAVLEKAIGQVQVQQHSVTGYLVVSDPGSHRYIVGINGSQIDKIRKQTGCRIQVPRAHEKGGPIEIVGSKDGVENAKEIILGVVRKGGNSGNGRRTE